MIAAKQNSQCLLHELTRTRPSAKIAKIPPEKAETGIDQPHFQKMLDNRPAGTRIWKRLRALPLCEDLPVESFGQQ
jgi:hypothetical protein